MQNWYLPMFPGQFESEQAVVVRCATAGCLLIRFLNGITQITPIIGHDRCGASENTTPTRLPWNRFPKSLSTNSSTTSHIPAYAPVPSSEDAGGEGAKNALSPPSVSRPNATWSVGARTSRRIQVAFLPTSVPFDSNASTHGATLPYSVAYSKRSPR
jgi:hypothetical protein